MSTEGSRSSGSAADSYIGSLISLTSKSEIRYEGVLYNINTDESSIGLRDVRSFGTEGRKKDGPQIPPSDRVYEYILFRGSDIKDLQVKSSSALQNSSPINNDPAIIQSQHSHLSPASTSLPSSVVSSTTLSSMQTSLLEQPAQNTQNGAPLHQPGGNVGSWGPSPSNANGIPTYWQGYYASHGGQLSHQNQQSVMRPPGLSGPSLLQQQQEHHYLPQQMPLLQLPSSLLQQVPSSLQSQMSSSLQLQNPASSLQSQMPSSLQLQNPASSLQTLMPSSLQQQLPSSLQQMPSSLQQQLPSSLSSLHQQLPYMNQQMPSSLHQPLHHLSAANLNSTLPAPVSLFTSVTSSGSSGILTSTSTLPSSLPLTFPLLPVTSLALDATSSLIPTKAPIAAPVPNKTPATSLSPATSLLSSGLDGNTLLQPLSSKPTGQVSQQKANVPQSAPSKVLAGNSISTQAPAPALLTPGHLVKSLSIPSAPSSQIVRKDVEVVNVSPSLTVETAAPVEPERKQSVLPLVTPSQPIYKQNGSSVLSYNGYRGGGRGRGRGRGIMNSCPLIAFNEEFDFTAMNEKFKKDEVWGHLGKSNKTHDHQEDGKHADEESSQHKDIDLPKIEVKPVYNKDDFFDSLSSNALDQEANHGRHRFSEQRKLDTETFGELSRYRGGRGGHGPSRGNYRGSFNGRAYGRGGYGYGRGRGRGIPNKVPYTT